MDVAIYWDLDHLILSKCSRLYGLISFSFGILGSVGWNRVSWAASLVGWSFIRGSESLKSWAQYPVGNHNNTELN